ncbi:1-acyl-sn-glycerol-3-phosphate acyltransferase [Pseudorhodobacter sp. E13]|uniref:lysophospholipid acyltransferase family protein n=1 Tax=Pseudorhodobacter sp. E13 TaxID=2487931 RepID=UPI000F8C6B88|nr:lysophospholipid acyltransferase family protein [Pseudorhodobacter sp. E13]RUS63119.1 1-acyl-sn-glycerol-3-phosphate acyltransferase [Pseudorhodobacter sp. E13]
MSDWREDKPRHAAIGGLGWLRVILRIIPFFLVTYGGLMLLLLARAIEAPLCGKARPVTPFITQTVCRAVLRIMGLRLTLRGTPMQARGAVVANHASWLDIFVLNACDRVYFVSKAEVAQWPGIGWLARATGTVFIARDPAEAKAQQALFEERLRAGHRLLFFPEGTSTDSLRVLPFKSTLFAAFFTHGMEHVMHIQPVSLRYVAPEGADPRLYGWWGAMDFAPHLLRVLAQPLQGRVDVIFHSPVAVDDFKGRKELAAHCETVIRNGFDATPPAVQP